MMGIPNIKLNPKDILPILKIVKQFENDSELMKTNIHRYLVKVAPTGSISYRNAVFALAFHTLRVLKLIKGRGKNLRLEIDAEILLDKYEKEGSESYNKELAKLVARIDRETGNVLKAIGSLNKENFHMDEIEKQLERMTVESPSKGGKLSKWLRLLRYTGFIEKINDEYKYNAYQLDALDRVFQEITLEDFFIVLKYVYDELTKKRRGNPYIPIPEIEEAVVRKLSDKGFTTFDFRNYLKKLKNKQMKGFTVYFSKPGAREANGLRIDGTYYYYIAIFGEQHVI